MQEINYCHVVQAFSKFIIFLYESQNKIKSKFYFKFVIWSNISRNMSLKELGNKYLFNSVVVGERKLKVFGIWYLKWNRAVDKVLNQWFQLDLEMNI